MNIYDDYIQMIHDCSFRIDPAWIYPEEGRDLFYRASYQPLLYLLTQAFQPTSILEIGVRAGYSAMALLDACPDATYIGLDNASDTECDKGMLDWAEQIIIGKFGNARIIRTDTQKELLPAEVRGKTWDMVFIDGDHSTLGVNHDLNSIWPLVKEGGRILMHDLWHQSVVSGLGLFLQNSRPWFSMHTFRAVHGGIILLTKERDPWHDPACRNFDRL